MSNFEGEPGIGGGLIRPVVVSGPEYASGGSGGGESPYRTENPVTLHACIAERDRTITTLGNANAEAARAIAALRAALAAAKADVAELHSRHTILREDRDAAQRDAERYRWLREAPPHSVRWPRWRIEHWNGVWNPVQGSDLDAAIDAAIAGSKT